MSTDAEATRECIGRVSPYDAEQWKAWSAAFDQTLATLFGLVQSPARPLAALSGAARAGPGAQPLVSHLLLYPVRETLEARFHSEQVRGLVAAWGMHLDFAPDTPGGSPIPFLETNADAHWGIGLAQGGSGTLPQALADLIRDTGGEVRLRVTAHRIHIEDNRASSVEVGDAETIRCRRAVVTRVRPPALLRLTGDRLIGAPSRRRPGPPGRSQQTPAGLVRCPLAASPGCCGGHVWVLSSAPLPLWRCGCCRWRGGRRVAPIEPLAVPRSRDTMKRLASCSASWHELAAIPGAVREYPGSKSRLFAFRD